MDEKRIKNIYLHLTKRCNLKCDYCYFDAGKKEDGELSLPQMLNLFGDIAKLSPQKVVITGGEALLREDFFEIVALWQAFDHRRGLPGRRGVAQLHL